MWAAKVPKIQLEEALRQRRLAEWLVLYMKFESAVWWTIIDGGWKVEELGEYNVGHEHGKTTL